MRTLPLLIALVFGSLALGCRSNNGQVLVEQEARMLEDEVYSLEAQLAACCQAREALARENEELRRNGGGGSSSSSGVDRAPAASSPSKRRPPLTEAPRLEAPSIELPEPSSTPPETLLPGNEPKLPAPGDNGGIPPQPVELVINKRMTGGLDRDRKGGDEGILVIVEPRDEQGNLVRTPGAVSVVLMDPSQTGEASRVARWDFQAHEFQQHFKKSVFGEGLQYELKWPGDQPANRDLMLFVRYISPEGAKLTSDTPMAIRLAGDYPRESREALVAAQDEPRPEPEARSQVRIPAAGEEPRAIETADESSRPGRALIAPREANRNVPEWKPFR
jgi:hypothetical protein